jgi:hypothetical protein
VVRGVIMSERPRAWSSVCHNPVVDVAFPCSALNSLGNEQTHLIPKVSINTEHTVHASVTGNPHHSSSTICLLAELNSTLHEPCLVLLTPYSALYPAWCNVIDSYTLLPAAPPHCLHKTSQSIFGGCIFPVTLSVSVRQVQYIH